MCEPVSTIAAIGGLLSGGAAVHNATQGKPRAPSGRQEAKLPDTLSARKRQRGAGPAYGAQTPSLLAGSSSVASNSLLGS